MKRRRLLVALIKRASFVIPFFVLFSCMMVQPTQAIPTGFQTSVIFQGLNQPTSARFAPDGRVFVSEKGGRILVYNNINSPTPTLFADLSSQVYNFDDLGLMSLAVDPQFPTRPYIYVDYVMKTKQPSGRLSRLQASGNVMTGPEVVLIEGWCQESGTHGLGNLMFASDGSLYLSAGEGAHPEYVDYGQNSVCGDPPNEGGALRAQDLATSGDPVGLSGTLLRVNPDTGAALPTNPLFGGRTDDDRIIAYGLRNPYRFTIHPTKGEIWLGDVGWNTWEEINRIPNPLSPQIKNFGWPCYEGPAPQPGYQAANLPICQNLYAAGTATMPHYVFSNVGGSAISGLAFYNGGNYPAKYVNALFFGNYGETGGGTIKAMLPDANGVPDPQNIEVFLSGSVFPVDLQVGIGGDIYFVDIAAGQVKRIQYFSSNTPPVAVAQANLTSGPTPLTVNFTGSASYDPDPGNTISYAWDLDGNGQYNDSTLPNPSYTYTTKGTYNVGLKVTDNQGATGVANLSITVGNSPPVATILSPLTTTTYKVGDTINFMGTGNDPDTGPLPASNLSWRVLLHHCSRTNPQDCHVHYIQDFNGLDRGSFTVQDHEYPSNIEIQLTATEANTVNWWDTTWNSRTKLTFNNGAQTENLDNFPLLVKLNSSRIDYTKTQAGGKDLRFVDSNNQLLAYDIEEWNPAGTSYLWVKVPRIGARSTTDSIFMYYGNPSAPDGQNKPAVWSDGYAGVWHLNKVFTDSTTNANNGTNFSSTDTPGLFASGRAFSGSNQSVRINHSPSLAFTAAQSYAVSAWLNVPALPNQWQGAVVKSVDKTPWYGIWLSQSNQWVYGTTNDITGPTVTTGWHYLTLAQNGPAATRNLYVDGLSVGSGPAVNANGTGMLWFGGGSDGTEYFKGTLDEVRISNVARSASWEAAQYLSMNDTFITYDLAGTGGGLSDTKSVTLYPQISPVTFQTNPPGLNLVVYGISQLAPFSFNAVIGGQISISAVSPQTLNNNSYSFTSWSDGGAQTHNLVVTQAPQTLTANFSQVAQTPETVWNSYSITPKSTTPQATVLDAAGTVTATLEFYESTDNAGVTKGTLFSKYTAGAHVETFNRVEKFWSPSTGTNAYPYVGKSTVNRGADVGETNAPAPAGVRDLQIHPNNNNHLVVAAFIVPQAGTYTISNLAVRRIDPTGPATARYKVFNQQKVLLANLQATNDRAWVTDSNVYTLSGLKAGDRLYFAVDRDGDYAFDATEIAWTVKRIGN